jgi:hypothetical protein
MTLSRKPPSNTEDSLAEWNSRIDRWRLRDPGAPLSSVQGVQALPSHKILELACRDIIRSWKSNCPRPVEEYLLAFEQLQSQESILDLIDAELCGCNWAGQSPEDLDLPGRFPDLREAIEQLIALLQVETAMSRRPSRNQPSLPVPPDGYRLNQDQDASSPQTSRGYSGVALEAGNRLWLVRLSEAIDESVLAKARGAFASLTKLQHPRIWPLIDLLTSSDQALWVIAAPVHGTTLFDRLINGVSDKRLLQWLVEIGGVLTLLENEKLPAGPIDLEEIRINHNEQLIVPTWCCIPASKAIDEPAAPDWKKTLSHLITQIVSNETIEERLKSIAPATRLWEDLLAVESQCDTSHKRRYLSAEEIWMDLVSLLENRPRPSLRRK